MPSVSAVTLPFSFNPPPHPSLLHNIPAWGLTSSEVQASRKALYDEEANRYNADRVDSFKSLRLGRIVMGKDAFTFALGEAGTRYGFRFLYNPTTVSGGSNVGTDFIPDPSSTITAVLQDGLEVINFELLLNRTPDIMGPAKTSDYQPFISEQELSGILERGTRYDLEYLYRVCNGLHNTNQMTGTGDIGILLPNPCELFLGPYRSRGALVSISATDQIFSGNMVPMLTYVQVSFSRYLTMNPSETSVLESTGVTVRNADPTTSADGSTPATNTPSSTAPMSGAQVYNLAKGAGWNATDATTATQIAFRESSWKPTAVNSLPCLGLWQINMQGQMGANRRKQYNLPNNEALYDATTNARVAYSIWKGRGNWTDWETYTNGSYKSVPISW